MKMVTKVIDYKLMNGKRYYKVKWECTWEREDNLFHCQELVDQFWDFVNRVKSEDNRIPIRKKARIDYGERANNKATKISSISEYTDLVPCIQLKHEHNNNSKPDDKPQYFQRENKFRDDNNDDDADGGYDDDIITKTVNMNSPIVVTSVVIGNERDINNTVSNHQSIANTTPPPTPTLQISSNNDNDSRSHGHSHHSSVLMSTKRSYEILDGDSEENSAEDIEMQRQEIVKPDSIFPDITYVQDPNDLAFHWKNPYVRITFKCRICNQEQPFSNNDEKWKKHFLMHVEGAHQEEDFSEPNIVKEASLEDMNILQDPEKPWIQKVEYIIQTWGVNQYVRLAFLCRSCGKEQQPLHTGNWRNHYNSHQHNKPHPCQKCSKTFKSKFYLKQHLKIVHDEVEGKSLRSCFICAKVFTRRLDMQRHIADVHKIDPKHQMSPVEWEYKSPSMASQFRTNQHDTQNENIRDKTDLNNDSFLPQDSELPSFSNNKSMHSDDLLRCGKCSQTYPSKGDLRRHRKNCHSPSENLYEKKDFKHTCAICQERFKRKIDLKCHTVNVHCIDISHSTSNTDLSRNELREPLTPSMVDLVQNNRFTNDFSNRFVDDIVEDRTSTEPNKLQNNDLNNEPEELLIIVKEEIIGSEDEGNCSNELTIDEKPSSDD